MNKLSKKQFAEYLNKLKINANNIFFDIYANILSIETDKRFTYSVDSFEFENGLFTVLLCRVDIHDITNLQVIEIVQSNNDDYFNTKKEWLKDFCK